MWLFELSSLYPMAKPSLISFLSGASTALAASYFFVKKRDERRVASEQAAAERKRAQRAQQKRAAAVAPPPAESSSSPQPRAELLVSAGPRKSNRETELGEDVAGTIVTAERIVFWVLDGTSDSTVITGEQGRDIFSSRLFCLAISAALYQLAHKYTDAHKLAEAAFDAAKQQLQRQLEQHQSAFRQFGQSEPPETAHWDVSTTMLLGILSASGELDLFRIGDSKALCFSIDKLMVPTVIDQKPSSIGLGRIYARLLRGEAFTIDLFTPERPEQLHRAKASNVSRIIAFSDGIGPSTEQYLRRMLSQRTYDQFHDELSRTPNKTFDDKTLVLASFEPMS